MTTGVGYSKLHVSETMGHIGSNVHVSKEFHYN